MANQSPRVSIGLPVYNGERFIAEALSSILAQTFGDFELLISDNGSTDQTKEICCEYARKDGRVRYLRSSTNVGASRNFNRVFELSSGKYFRWAAADDLFAPDSLEKCVAVLDAHPEVVLCYPKTVLIDDEGNAIRSYDDNLDLRSSNVSDRFRRAVNGIGLVNALYGLIRSQVLRQTSLYGNYPGTDVDLLIELSLYGQFWEIPDQLFFRRMHAQAHSAIKTLDGRQEFFDPQTKGELFLPLWRHAFQQFVSIMRAPLKISVKIHLACVFLRESLKSWDDFLKELFGALSNVSRTRRVIGTPRLKV